MSRQSSDESFFRRQYEIMKKVWSGTEYSSGENENQICLDQIDLAQKF